MPSALIVRISVAAVGCRSPLSSSPWTGSDLATLVIHIPESDRFGLVRKGLPPVCADQNPRAQSRKPRDLPRLRNELVPRRAAMVDDRLLRGEDPVRQKGVANQLPPTFPIAFDSGARAGKGTSVMLPGTFSLGVTCQPARPIGSTA